MAPRNLTILDRVGYTYFETDLSGILTSMNDSLCKALGYGREELVGQAFSDFATAKHNQPVLETVLQTGQAQMGIEYHLRCKDQHMIYAEGGISLKLDGDGKAIGFRGVFMDVTEHKQVEENLTQAKEKFERELEIGRRIQESFLPAVIPSFPGWEIASFFESARYVSGDFYDVFTLGDGSKAGLVLADVCDKGVGAALFMALVRSLLRAFSEQFSSARMAEALSFTPTGVQEGNELSEEGIILKHAVDFTNDYLIRNHGDTSMFATLFYGVIDTASGRLHYVNAGHEPPMILGDQGIKTRLMPTDPAIGLMPEHAFNVKSIQLEPGNTMMTYTDGVIDTISPQEERFSEKRLIALVEESQPRAEALLEKIHQALEAHMSGADQFDDITMLAVSRLL